MRALTRVNYYASVVLGARMPDVDLQEKIRSLPDAPGVYLFTDAEGALLYVGKASSLRRRVQTYFSERDFGYDAERLGSMVAPVADVEYVLTANDVEALILESNLIKERRPRYNIVLRDDKHYPFIRLNPKDPYPALQVVRRIRRDGALYFGPYVPAGTMWTLLALIHRTFPLRTCRSISGRNRCLEYHLGRCQAPCEGLVTPGEYGQTVQKAQLLLEARTARPFGNWRHRCRRRQTAWSSSGRPASGTRSPPCAGPGKGSGPSRRRPRTRTSSELPRRGMKRRCSSCLCGAAS